MFTKKYPYTDFNEYNLDFILKEVRNLHKEWDEFKIINSIKYVGAWDITKSYESFSLVSYANRIYISVQPVTAGTDIFNTDFWEVVVDYDLDITTPELYGAIGDGLHDDTVAIQAAIDNAKCVYFNGKHTYAISGITVGENRYLYGNGCKIVGNGSGSLITVQTYTGSQEHTSIPTFIKDFQLDNADILIDVNKALKISIDDIVLSNFNTGLKFQAGYELLCSNFRYEGDPANTSAIGLDITGGGDSVFHDFIGRDVANPLKVQSGSNTFTDFHFWILTASLFPYSIYINDVTNTDARNQYIRFYFDTYKILLNANGYAQNYFDAPIILMNSSIVQQECTFINIVNDYDLYIKDRLRIENACFHVTNDTLCNICNDLTAPIYMTYLAVSAAQYAKISAANVYNRYREITYQTITELFTFESGMTLKSGSVFHDRFNKRITGSMVIEYSSGFVSGGLTKVCTPVNAPINAINTGCFASSSEWSTEHIAYLYIASNGISVKCNESGNTIAKINVDYKYN